MATNECLTCGGQLMTTNLKFCGRRCYAEAYRRGLITNRGWFRKGQASPNKGRTLASWVGEERARQIRERMSRNSKKKAEFLRLLNTDKEFLRKRAASRRVHEQIVKGIVDELRARGRRCYILSEYVREKRVPDAIVFYHGKLSALEIEQEKRYKPSAPAIVERLSSLNGLSNFFDETKVLFVSPYKPVKNMVNECLKALI